MFVYNWQFPNWPNFTFDLDVLEDTLFAIAKETGEVTGMLNTLPDTVKSEMLIDALVIEGIKTSEIEGEYLNRQDVISSIKNNLGVNAIPEPVKDKKADGIGKLMVAIRNTLAEPITEEKLFCWHTLLMSGNHYIKAGAWRSGTAPMQVVSGAVGKEKVHFEAPPSHMVPSEMNLFIDWFNQTAPGGVIEIKRAAIRSSIAHLYFESIHPFEDGNGRLGRAIAEKALYQTSGQEALISLSKNIEANKKAYYQNLESAQKCNNITIWMIYFLGVILEAQKDAKQLLAFTIRKAIYFDAYKDLLNERQLKTIGKMFDAGISGFEGGLNATKYISITKTSKATATRDLHHLVVIGALIAKASGRSTHYILNI